MKTKKERRISIRLGIFLGYGILMLSVVLRYVPALFM